MTAATAITIETHNPVRTKLHDRAGSASPDLLISAWTELFISPPAYEWMEEEYPDLFKEIKQRVKQGRWEIVGGMWVAGLNRLLKNSDARFEGRGFELRIGADAQSAQPSEARL